MQVMCRGLEVAAGDRLRSILEKLTSRRWMGVLVGAGITAIIQSSSATTVMVVGFVNSGLMTLGQAVGVIMGANVGTTVTGLLIALDIGMIAPLFAFLGVAIIMVSKKQRTICIAEIMAGLGILFIGMDMMSSAMSPLRDYPPFVNMLSSFSNPLLGILAGAAFTALVQSSSASIGILQALAFFGSCWIRQCCLCAVWSEYWYLYHCCYCQHGCKPSSKTHYFDSPDVQLHWHSNFYLYLHVYPPLFLWYKTWFPEMFPDKLQPHILFSILLPPSFCSPLAICWQRQLVEFCRNPLVPSILL